VDEISETKTPNAGEWWVDDDDGTIVFVCGSDPDGDPVFMDDDEELHIWTLRFFTEEYHHEPRCTGFDWLPLAEVWPKWIIADHWSDTAYVRRDSADANSSYTIDGKKRETKNGKPSHEAASIDSLIANKTWRYATEVEALARVQHPTMDRPVQPDDWVEFDPAHITCPRISIDWLTPRLGESQDWGPALLVWSNATWAAQRENWKIRCFRSDLPKKLNDIDAIIAEHTTQVRELTQRIGDLVQQVNERDAVIERIRTALRQEYSV
jgi:hypothetical protein